MRYGAKSNLSFNFVKPKLFHFSKMIQPCRLHNGEYLINYFEDDFDFEIRYRKENRETRGWYFQGGENNSYIWWSSSSEEIQQLEIDAYFDEIALQKTIKQYDKTTTRRAL